MSIARRIIDRGKSIAPRRARVYGKKNDRDHPRNYFSALSRFKRIRALGVKADISSDDSDWEDAENCQLRCRRKTGNADEADSVYSDDGDCWIKAEDDGFQYTPRRSVAMAKESAAVCLADVAVEPLQMVHLSQGKRGAECYFPTYTLTDTKTGRVLKFFKHINGGKADDPTGACVTAYQDGDGRVVIVKTLPAEDDTNEAMLVHQVTQLRQCLKGAMVNARLARVAQEPGCGKVSCDPKHYSVVLMHYAGQTLTTLNLKQCSAKAMFVTRGVALTCLRLYENGFVYADMKPANVLYAGLDYNTIRLTLCDYGGLAPVGATDAVATYPPPEHPFGTSVHATERAVVYGLGVLLVCLFTEDLEYNLRFLKREKNKKGKYHKDNGRVHACSSDAVLAMQMACDKVIGALRAQDESIARVVQLAWHPKTTIQELIAAIDGESSAHELETMEPASPETKTPASPEFRSSQSEFSDD
jgi:hypothetical protein